MIMKSFPCEGTGSADKGPLAAGLLPSQLPLPTELSADKGPLAAGLLPSQLPLPTELSAYKAFATVGAGLDYVNVPVPHYFGAWKYMPLRMPSFPDASPVTPQFTVLLVEDLFAPGLDGQTLLDYFYPVKQTRPDITAAERDLGGVDGVVGCHLGACSCMRVCPQRFPPVGLVTDTLRS
ncbi:hypothetical protein L211DRAFT_417419 [Terfezia boudieri ATCC MYA-4762]|uniref:Uncharacterized protein n=1 Tax=Terfezia boudieri ATCC MYA-4762 TaxID=1051890 RepID=A0A3N4LJX1_9PEZI|nr:hypothetical protein L211DRAFT_417419 [Terfezia boudieri ATCC MYA-4762]